MEWPCGLSSATPEAIGELLLATAEGGFMEWTRTGGRARREVTRYGGMLSDYRPLPRNASNQKVRQKIHTGSSSSGLRFSANSFLNMFLRGLFGLRTRQRSYTYKRTICLQCYWKVQLKKAAVPALVLGLFAYMWFQMPSGNTYAQGTNSYSHNRY